MLGLSARKYCEAVRAFTDAYGLDFTEPRLYIPDGGKVLHAAVRKYAGESAPIQRCPVHKRRKVLDHVTDEDKPLVAKKRNAAYELEDYEADRKALDGFHRELTHLNPGAARSLGEGPGETFTASCSPAITHNPGRHQRDRIGFRHSRTGLPQRQTLVAQKQVRRVRGHKRIPMLLRVPETLSPSRKEVTARRKAS